MEIGTNEEIDPNQIVDHRTDVTEEYNETFVELLEMPLSELKHRTTFRGLNPLAERSVLVALQRRYKVLTT